MNGKWLSSAECRDQFGLTFYALRTLRKSGRVRAVKATPRKWLYNREDIDRVFEPVPHDAEWRADLAYVEQHTA